MGGRQDAVRSNASGRPTAQGEITMNPNPATEYRNLPLNVLTESATNTQTRQA
jgi:hypothetical protein